MASHLLLYSEIPTQVGFLVINRYPLNYILMNTYVTITTLMTIELDMHKLSHAKNQYYFD